MSIGTDIIKDALKQIGAHSIVSPAAPETIEDGRVTLNSMLEMWLSKNIVIGATPLSVAGDELNEPADCRNAIVFNLAILFAGPFGNGKQIVSPELRSNARKSFSDVRGLYGRLNIPEKVLSSTTPIGAGNRRSTLSSDRFWTKGDTVEN